MKRNLLLKEILLYALAGLVFSVSGYSQQTYSTYMSASLVIGQPDFSANYKVYGQSIALGPGYTAISSKGVLAVALLEGNGVFLWNTIPSTNGELATLSLVTWISIPGHQGHPRVKQAVVVVLLLVRTEIN